jgi:diacylglycerol kinase family enzyme
LELDRLVVAGGDGTVNEVLNGLRDPGAVPLCHFGVGTANMLARELGLPKNPEFVAQIIETGAVLPIDVGLVNGHRFLSLVSAGFDGLVTKEIVGLGRKIRGYCGYARPIAKALRRYRPVNLEVRVDGRDTFIGTNVMVLKVRKYGGIFVFARNASFDSGSFEVRVFSGRSLFSLAKYGLAGVARVTEALRDVHRVSAGTVEISADCPFPVEADGDYIGSGAVSISLAPQKLRAIVPLRTEHARVTVKRQPPCLVTPDA